MCATFGRRGRTSRLPCAAHRERCHCCVCRSLRRTGCATPRATNRARIHGRRRMRLLRRQSLSGCALPRLWRIARERGNARVLNAGPYSTTRRRLRDRHSVGGLPAHPLRAARLTPLAAVLALLQAGHRCPTVGAVGLSLHLFAWSALPCGNGGESASGSRPSLLLVSVRSRQSTSSSSTVVPCSCWRTTRTCSDSSSRRTASSPATASRCALTPRSPSTQAGVGAEGRARWSIRSGLC